MTEHGVKLPVGITGEKLLELYHANRPGRIHPILPFLEYAKNGGELQVSAVGYGASKCNGPSAQTNTFTLKKFGEALNAQLLECTDKEWDVYLWNRDNMLIGYDDGTDILAGIPMSTVYPIATQYPTSSARSAVTVSFSHEDVEDSQLHFGCVQLDPNPKNFIKGLIDAMFQKLRTENTYKMVEVVGDCDHTEEFGSLTTGSTIKVINNITSTTYSDGIITVVPRAGTVPSLKAPFVLYEKGIEGIEQVS